MQKLEKNNRMRKIRELFKKIGGNKGTFHARISTLKYRNDKDLTEAKELARKHRTIQKRSS